MRVLWFAALALARSVCAAEGREEVSDARSVAGQDCAVPENFIDDDYCDAADGCGETGWAAWSRPTAHNNAARRTCYAWCKGRPSRANANLSLLHARFQPLPSVALSPRLNC